jgi:signal transduction histidine kinase/ActR/RegA family two-component response regulator
VDVKRELRPFRILTAAAALFALIAIMILIASAYEAPSLHTLLDSGTAVLSGVLAFLFWDMGWRVGDRLARLLALAFAIVAGFESIHAFAAVEFSMDALETQRVAARLRPVTWPPPAYLLPSAVGAAFWLRNRYSQAVLALGISLLLLGAGLIWIFSNITPYTSPTWFGITRPSLALVPALWVVVGIVYWQGRAQERVAEQLALFSILAVVGNTIMLYSQAPADDPAMLAHAGNFANRLFLLFTLIQLGTIDTARRMRAERDLTRLNEELEERVRDRTVALEATNAALRDEAATRELAERKTLAQLDRLHLLQQITHAIGERQDLDSIFQVVVGSLEEHMPVDFVCLCHYDQIDCELTVARVGTKSARTADAAGLTHQARIEIDENGLSRCVHGQLVYEPDIAAANFPFPRRLARHGLRSLVAVPLLAERRSGVFGVLVVARNAPNAFTSADCEFLDQLGENVALASNEAQLHSALQHAYDELRDTQHAIMQQERLRALGEMASGIAHDINNAISPATLYVETILERDSGLDSRTRSQLETVQRAIGDVAQTVARMGEFYRKRDSELTLAPVNINSILDQVPDLTRARWSDMAQARGTAIDVRVEPAVGTPTIMAIESEIREALINLVFNAADAMPDGGTITLRARRVAGAPPFSQPSTAIEVSDNGVGMDEKTHSRCLEPFFTTKGERGTGLGLAMVYGIAQRHGAELQIESEVGIGTTVRLLFPDSAGVDSAVPKRLLQRNARKLRILVIDDDPTILGSLRDALEHEGHHVTCAHGGQAGIDMFCAACDRNEPFVAVITDLGMPRVDGRQVAAAIKAKVPDTTVVMLTGWGQRLADSGDVPACVDRILSKPPNIWNLRDALAAAGDGAPIGVA